MAIPVIQRWARGALAALALVSVFAAQAQDAYPSKPIRIIIPFPPAGITDLHARTVYERVGTRLKQPVVFDNRAGAGGRIGTELAMRAPADGYTLTIMNGAINVLLPVLVPNLPYRTLEHFEPIAKVVVSCPMVVVHPSVPANSLKELVEYARSRPGAVNLGIPGLGNFAHIQGEQLMKTAGIKVTLVPFKGEAEVMRDLIAGHVHMTFAAAVQPQVQAGQMKALATTCPKRTVTFPDIPTVAEAGFPAITGEGWQGIGAPAGTPPHIVQMLANAIREAVADPAVVQRLNGGGLNVDFVGPAEFRDFIARDTQRQRQMITEFGIKIE
ncbi:MAG TPA: tripartite tricarboxylate transporter substrate binding protein [Ramlibacter sp.]|nr:tripartite tricarboxylate transporter substrate binding protein [Ramlibacter sp.]